MSDRVFVWEETARRSILLITVACVPLIMLPDYTLDPFNVPKLALLLVGTGLALLSRAVRFTLRPEAIAATRLRTPVLALFVPLLLSWALASPYKGWALWGEYERFGGLIPQIVFAGFALLVLDTFKDRHQEVLSALILAGATIGAYTVLQRFELDPFVWSGSQNGATLGNPNYSGSFLAICLPIALWAAFNSRGRHRDLGQLAVVPIIAGLILATSQGPWAAAVVALLVLAASVTRKPSLKAGLLAMGAALALAIVMAVPFSLTEPGERLLGVTVQDRAFAGAAALQMAAENPILGSGPDTFAVEAVRYRTQEQAADAIATIDDPHSALLYYLSSAGLLGALGFLIVAGWSLRRTWAPAPDSKGNLSPAVFAGLSAYLTATLVTHDQPTLRLSFWVLLALAAGQSMRPAETAPVRNKWAAVPAIGGALTLIILGAAFVATDRAALQGSRAALDNQPAVAIPWLESSVRFDPTLQHRKLFAQRLGELGTRRGKAGEPLYLRSKDLFRYLDRFPDVDGLIRAGRLAFAWGVKVDEAELGRALDLYGRARSADRYHPLLAAERADVMLEAGQVDEATASLEALRSVYIPFPAYWSLLTEAYVMQRDFDRAYEALSQAVAYGTENPETLAAAEMYRQALDLPVTAVQLVNDLSEDPIHETP